MDVSLECIYCTIKKADLLFSQYKSDQSQKLKFMKKVFKIVSEAKEHDTSSYLNGEIMRLLSSELNLGDMYYEIKKECNKLVSSIEKQVSDDIYDSCDKLYMALKYAMIGNFIDFRIIDQIDVDKLRKLIHSIPDQIIDENEYKHFLKDLKEARKIAYITDNAGEIVFDKIFIKVIKELYPNIVIDVIVRGKPIYNDATIADVRQIGLCDIVNVIENDTDIPGTQLDKISIKSKDVINNADLIIAKGQGNVETLLGCGKNIYYIFLCKCDLFARKFNVQKFKGMFINESCIDDRIK